MRDITQKPDTLRRARAQATIEIPAECMARIEAGTIDKGDPREAARIAAYMAAKKTWELLPHCHPLPLHHCLVEFEQGNDRLRVIVEVSTVGPTGVEMEALTAASIAALTIYDMLKPHAGRDLRISGIELDDKRGGKTDFARRLAKPARALVLTCSTAVVDGLRADSAAEQLCSLLAAAGFASVDTQQLGDPAEPIAAAVQSAIEAGIELIATVGGTGINPGDQSIEAVQPLIVQDIPGLMEAARGFGQKRTPYALMSRGIAGRTGNSLIVTFPGSSRAVVETWQAIASGLLHAVDVIGRTAQ